MLPLTDSRPVIVALAGPNGAGKTTFFHTHLRPAGLRFVNADILAKELSLDPYPAATLAAGVREVLLAQRESFVFETVFSDPAGDKLAFLKSAAAAGYRVILCFIGISGVEVSERRVAMRVAEGGHDVPAQKLRDRFPRTLANLAAAIRELPEVHVYDNSDLRKPYRLVALVRDGNPVKLIRPIPPWLAPLIVSSP